MGKEREIIANFSKKKVLLIGDSILDVYVYGTAIGKSLETPTIVAKEHSRKVSFGGASLVARNLLELGASVNYITLIGNDEDSDNYKGLKHENLHMHFVVDPSRSTTIKKRFWVDGYKLLQFDTLDNRDLESNLIFKVLKIAKKLIRSCDVVIISDYRHGLMTSRLIRDLKKLLIDSKKPVFVDSQISHRESNHMLYKDLFMILLNEVEAKSIDEKFSLSFDVLSDVLGKSNICIKLGENGSICKINGKIIRSRASSIKVVDTCGAGDAFIAALALGDLNEIEPSLRIANCWAGLSVQVQGPEPPKKKELLKIYA